MPTNTTFFSVGRYDLSLDICPAARLGWLEACIPTAAEEVAHRWQLSSAHASLVSDMDSWGWSDFALCKWPDELETPFDTFTGKQVDDT